MLFSKAVVCETVQRVPSICPARLRGSGTGGNLLSDGGIDTRRPSSTAFLTVREESTLSNLEGSRSTRRSQASIWGFAVFFTPLRWMGKDIHRPRRWTTTHACHVICNRCGASTDRHHTI